MAYLTVGDEEARQLDGVILPLTDLRIVLTAGFNTGARQVRAALDDVMLSGYQMPHSWPRPVSDISCCTPT
jgi:hypothetical protein